MATDSSVDTSEEILNKLDELLEAVKRLKVSPPQAIPPHLPDGGIPSSLPASLRKQFDFRIQQIAQERDRPGDGPADRAADAAERRRRAEEGAALAERWAKSKRKLTKMLKKLWEDEGDEEFAKLCKKACRRANIPFNRNLGMNIPEMVSLIAAMVTIADYAERHYESWAAYAEEKRQQAVEAAEWAMIQFVLEERLSFRGLVEKGIRDAQRFERWEREQNIA